MALSIEQVALVGDFDYFSCLVGKMRLAVAGGTDLWSRSDLGVEGYDNYLANFDATAADLAISTIDLGALPAVATWLKDIPKYLASVGGTSLSDYLAAWNLRVDAKTAQILSTAKVPVLAANIGADADGGALAPGQLIGALVQGGAISGAADFAYTVGGSVLAPVSPILARVTVKGATDWTISATCKRADATTIAVTGTVVVGTGSTGLVGDVYRIGERALSGGAAALQKVIPITGTTLPFKVGEKVLISQWSGAAPNEVLLEQEIGLVASIVTDTSITVTDNLLHTYTTDARVDPMFRGVTAASGSGGNTSDAVQFYAAPDRPRLKL